MSKLNDLDNVLYLSLKEDTEIDTNTKRSKIAKSSKSSKSKVKLETKIDDRYKRVRRFLYTLTAKENREIQALKAGQEKEKWTHKISLDEVTAYLKGAYRFDPFYEKDRNLWINHEEKEIKKQIKKRNK